MERRCWFLLVAAGVLSELCAVAAFEPVKKIHNAIDGLAKVPGEAVHSIHDAVDTFVYTHPCKNCGPEQAWDHIEEMFDKEKADLEKMALKKFGATYAMQKINPHASVEVSHGQAFGHWGTSLCWWAVGVGAWVDKGKLLELLGLIFSDFSADDLRQKVLSGAGIPPSLGLTHARYNIGGSPYQPIYDPETFFRAGGAVESFWLPNGTWNWSADAAQRTVLAGALRLGLATTQAFANSPPWWMTRSQSSTGAHGIGPIAWNNLADDNITMFAQYLAAVCDRYATDPLLLFGQTLVFDSISPLNEPGSLWWKYGNNQEGCHISYKQQPLVMDAVREQLQSRESTANLSLVFAEGNKLMNTLHSIRSAGKSFIDKVGILDTHVYGLDINRPVASNAKALQELNRIASEHAVPFEISEFGTGSGPLEGGLRLALRIIADLVDGGVTTWTLWQVVSLNQVVEPVPWGPITATYPPAEANFGLFKQYYAYKQFTAFIRPGSWIIGGCRFCAMTRTQLLLALMPDGITAVVVAVAVEAKKNTRFTLKLSGGGKFLNVLGAYLTDADANCSSTDFPEVTRSGALSLNLAPQSVTTFLVNVSGISLPSQSEGASEGMKWQKGPFGILVGAGVHHPWFLAMLGAALLSVAAITTCVAKRRCCKSSQPTDSTDTEGLLCRC